MLQKAKTKKRIAKRKKKSSLEWVMPLGASFPRGPEIDFIADPSEEDTAVLFEFEMDFEGGK